MTDRAPERLGVAVALLLSAASVMLVLGSHRSRAQSARAGEFQRLTGGLGWGTATSLADCAASFDPGVSEVCSHGLDPVPGAFAFCIHHAGPTIRR